MLSGPRFQSGDGDGVVDGLAVRPGHAAHRGAPHDNGTQFTSEHYREVAHRLGVKLSRTRYRHPDGNALVERIFLSLKQEEVWPQDYASFAEALASVSSWIADYNRQRPHQSLKYRTPEEVRREALGARQSAA